MRDTEITICFSVVRPHLLLCFFISLSLCLSLSVSVSVCININIHSSSKDISTRIIVKTDQKEISLSLSLLSFFVKNSIHIRIFTAISEDVHCKKKLILYSHIAMHINHIMTQLPIRESRIRSEID